MLLLNGKTERTLEALKSLFLSEYEAKAYFTLQVIGESKASEISRKSGVPQSKTYWTLTKLIEKGLVTQTQTKPAKFNAVSLGVAIELFKSERIKEFRKAKSSVKYLATILDSLANMPEKLEGQFAVFERPRLRR